MRFGDQAIDRALVNVGSVFDRYLRSGSIATVLSQPAAEPNPKEHRREIHVLIVIPMKYRRKFIRTNDIQLNQVDPCG